MKQADKNKSVVSFRLQLTFGASWTLLPGGSWVSRGPPPPRVAWNTPPAPGARGPCWSWGAPQTGTGLTEAGEGQGLQEPWEVI